MHKATKVRAWVEAHCDAIELFYLPPYAPELNPDEYRPARVRRFFEHPRVTYAA